jgi:hypothetical protein
MTMLVLVIKSWIEPQKTFVRTFLMEDYDGQETLFPMLPIFNLLPDEQRPGG